MILYLQRKIRIIKRKLKMSLVNAEVPLGVKFLQKLTDKCCPRLRFNRKKCFQASVVILTYVAYTCYHMSRKPIAVVKAVLNRNCSNSTPSSHPDDKYWCGWPPFDQPGAMKMFGEIDSSFLFCYAIAMFISGFIAERVNLRYFLSFGMLLSGIFCYLFGIAKTYDIHNLYYYIIIQGCAGIVQTSGWPGVVTIMSNWFGKSKRGLIFGLWNSHTSLGNILGTLIAGGFVEIDWSYSFIIPGLIIGCAGFIIYLFLVVSPSDVGLLTEAPRSPNTFRRLQNQVANDDSSGNSDVDDTPIFVGENAAITRKKKLPNDNTYIEIQRQSTEGSPLLPGNSSSQQSESTAIGFYQACKIPGVFEYSFCLFFSKLVNYTFLFWLPIYMKNKINRSPTLSADLSTLFDVGGIVGAVLAGGISDKTDKPATTCFVMLAVAAPLMFVYNAMESVSLGLNMMVLIVVGMVVNGPYALITTAVSADLGTHKSLEGNSKALATVTAIIDGTGSIGAAVGPLLAGFLQGNSWYFFGMLIISDILAMLLLLRLVKHELGLCQGIRRGIRRD